MCQSFLFCGQFKNQLFCSAGSIYTRSDGHVTLLNDRRDRVRDHYPLTRDRNNYNDAVPPRHVHRRQQCVLTSWHVAIASHWRLVPHRGACLICAVLTVSLYFTEKYLNKIRNFTLVALIRFRQWEHADQSAFDATNDWSGAKKENARCKSTNTSKFEDASGGWWARCAAGGSAGAAVD